MNHRLSNHGVDRLREVATFALLLPFVVAIALALVLRPAPERVRIVGEFDAADRARIEALLSSRGAAPIVSNDLALLRQRLEAEPWIDRAVVRRRWPDQLEVGVSLVRPLGQTAEGIEIMQTGLPGRVAERDPELPLFSAPESRLPRLIEVYGALRAPLRAAGLTIATLDAVSGGVWHVGTHEGVELALSDTDFTGQVRRILKGYRSLAGQGRWIGRIDGRYPDGIAVRPDPEAVMPLLADGRTVARGR